MAAGALGLAAGLFGGVRMRQGPDEADTAQDDHRHRGLEHTVERGDHRNLDGDVVQLGQRRYDREGEVRNDR